MQTKSQGRLRTDFCTRNKHLTRLINAILSNCRKGYNVSGLQLTAITSQAHTIQLDLILDQLQDNLPKTAQNQI